jgi:hypothetical protein
MLILLAAGGCGPEIGDKCSGYQDCSTDGSRLCDDTQPEGYCLIPGCRADDCPEEAVCVRFGENERGRTFCLKHCIDNSDCRGGYSCQDPGMIGDLPTAIIDEAPQGESFCMERIPE